MSKSAKPGDAEHDAAALDAALQSLQELLVDEGPQEPAERVEALREAISYLDRAYYVEARQVIPDVDYDRLFAELRSLEEAHPELLTADSPTQRVARGLSEDFPSVKHAVPMLSLENSYNAEDLNEWDRKIREMTGVESVAYSVEPKFDGSSISLYYQNDVLVQAATRGDGVQGENITNNVKVLRSIPLRADFSTLGIHWAEVRGEVVIAKTVFDAMNEKREADGLPRFQNPRNTAAGGLRMKDPQEVAQRGMEAFVFHLGYAVDKHGEDMLGANQTGLRSHSENLLRLYDMGFQIPGMEYQNKRSNSDPSESPTEPAMKVCQGIEAVQAFIAGWENRRDDYPWEIDGMVIKVNDVAMQRRCGSTSHHPRWAIAYKFKAKQATSRLLRVEYQVGRTGAVTPVAKLDPVSLAGVTISSVSLHNADQIAEKDIRVGDLLTVERAGDVIPYIAGVVPEARPADAEPFVFRSDCPSCGSILVREEGEVVFRCVNAECPAQAEERLIHFVAKNAMDIDGLGKDIVRRFYAEGMLRIIPDLYQLDYERILAMEGWGEKAVTNLREGIAASKNQPLFRLLSGLGIRHVGGTTAKALTRVVDNLAQLQALTEEELLEIEDIGPIVARSIVSFFAQAGNRDMLEQLRALGVNTTALPEEKPQDGIFKGKTFLFTGTLQRMNRSQAKEMVERLGGRNISGISSKLDVLVVGEKAGSKLKKAQAIGTIAILTEDEFLAQAGEG